MDPFLYIARSRKQIPFYELKDISGSTPTPGHEGLFLLHFVSLGNGFSAYEFMTTQKDRSGGIYCLKALPWEKLGGGERERDILSC